MGGVRKQLRDIRINIYIYFDVPPYIYVYIYMGLLWIGWLVGRLVGWDKVVSRGLPPRRASEKLNSPKMNNI